VDEDQQIAARLDPCLHLDDAVDGAIGNREASPPHAVRANSKQPAPARIAVIAD
jgi:hypothetical protein